MKVNTGLSLTMDMNIENKNNTHILFTVDADDPQTFDKLNEALDKAPTGADHLFYLFPIIADDLSKMGMKSAISITSNSWFEKTWFTWGIKISSKCFNRFGRDKFIQQFGITYND